MKKRESSVPARRKMRTFRLQGSEVQLSKLKEAIEAALEQTRGGPHRARGSSIGEEYDFEINVSSSDPVLKQRPSDSDQIEGIAEGFAAPKRCIDCGELVALLLDDAYLEVNANGDVACCRCWRERDMHT